MLPHFSWRNDNISVYKPFKHQHLAEIKQTLKSLQNSFNSEINLIPMRGRFSRGIFVAAYLDCPIALDEIKNYTKITTTITDLHLSATKCQT